MFLDTTLLIDFLRSKPKAKEIMEKFQSKPLFTSEINVFELLDGVYASGLDVEKHLEKVWGLLSLLTVLPFERKASLKAGMISGRLSHEGKKIGEIDCLIAGVALANGVTEIITSNTEHFEKIRELKIIGH